MALTTHSGASTYDVFLSFSGSDTRYGFTGNLYNALTDKGIHTFIDNEELQSGEEITPTFLKAIEESAIAITVLSKNYASSSFCLDELVTILDCAKRKGMLVLPVFYNIDPSDVRHLRGSYAQALAKHEKRFKQRNNDHGEKLQKWKMALCRVANLSGYHFKEGDGYEHVFIKKIVESVSRKVNRVALRVADHPVGLKSRALEVRKLLDYGSGGCAQIIGILGMGGIGKSTLARAVYNDLIAEHGNFDGFCFLENVREKSNKHGLEHLQSILLKEILGGKEINLTSVEEGARLIQRRLQQKKVLLILDDVDNRKQLEAIVGRPDWFGPGSRVIVTTRDAQLLKFHGIERTYEVEGLKKNDALQLLTWNAFKKEKADPSYEVVLNHVVNYASGLPLALKVMGSYLVGKSVEEWESAINQYKRTPTKKEILETLKLSLYDLEEEEKSVFIDIACCFKGCELTHVELILHALYDYNMKHHIRVLVEKSLIKISRSGTVEMHDLIQDMGRLIDQQDSPKEPSKRRRLWLQKDINKVLKDSIGTSENEILCLDFSISDKEETVEWNEKVFQGMKKLKVLINRKDKFSKAPDYFPKSLRLLEWHGYPLNCLTSLDDLWKKLDKLTILNFDGCKFLAQIPHISHLLNLKKLSFRWCENLTRVHESVGSLPELKILSAEGCKRLMSFPRLNMTSLERLELSDCSNLEKFPEISGKMKNIRRLSLSGLSKIELPWSFQNLIGLQELFLSCDNVRLPSSIALMPQLFAFDTRDCKGWQWVKPEEAEEKGASIASSKVYHFFAGYCNLNDDFFLLGFKWFAQVSNLCLAGNNFTFLPKCIEEFHSLYWLDVSDCKHLREIRGVPPNLIYFWAKDCISMTSSSSRMFLNQELYKVEEIQFIFPGTSIPEWFDQQNRGPSSSFWFRNKFPAKVLCLLIAPVVVNTLFGLVRPKVFINGKFHKPRFGHDDNEMSELDHTYLFDLQYIFSVDNLIEVALEKEWNHVEVTCAGMFATSTIKAFGIHVFKDESSMDNIRYIDPYKLDDDHNNSQS